MRAAYDDADSETEAPAAPQANGASPAARALARQLGLRYVTADALTIRRQRRGKGWSFLGPDGRVIRDLRTVRRLSRLAVPPAYRDVLYAKDPAAHLQAIGRDDAGRLQYRYHSDWEGVREERKARRLARLAAVLPRIHRSVARHLASPTPTREFALAAVIELVSCTAIRPGRESYARIHGTRGAATLLKSNVSVSGGEIRLSFRGKGGKDVVKTFSSPRMIKVLPKLRRLPGARLFQYRSEDGAVRGVRAREVNIFLREIAGVSISLKDFRTLIASASALQHLSQVEPGKSERQRREQVLTAVRAVADHLSNTPAICRRSYVHDCVVAAFERGALKRFGAKLRARQSPAGRAQALAKIIAAADKGVNS
jgi:DNA topoisomerase-1